MCWCGRRGAAKGVDDEVDDGVAEEGDDETDDGVEDGVFCVGDFFAVATGGDVADATPNEHDYADDADGEKDGVGDSGESAVWTDKVGGHAVATSGFGAVLDGVSSNWSNGVFGGSDNRGGNSKSATS